MVFDKKIAEDGWFEKDQKKSGWSFNPWEGDSYSIRNPEEIPIDTSSDYKVIGTLCRGNSREIKIVKTSRIIDEFNSDLNRDFNIFY